MKTKLRVALKSLSLSIGRALGFRAKAPPSELAGAAAKPYVNRIISDAILLNEIPSPTEKEEQRVGFIMRRLNDFGMSTLAVDDAGNVAMLWPASRPSDEYVLLFADIENEAYSPLESLVRLSGERAWGIGLADNSVGAAALLVLAEYLQSNGVFYDRNLLILFTSFSTVKGPPFAALEGFIRGWKGGIVAALYVTGLQLGSVESKPLGNCKLVVNVKTAQRPVFTYAGASSATAVLSSIAFQLGSIQWDEHNETTLNIARFLSGIGYGYFPSEGLMELEIYSGNMSVLEMSKNAVCATIQKIARDTGAQVQVSVTSFIPVGDPVKNQALVEALKEVHGELRIRTQYASTPDKTAVLNAFGIPAISVGITSGKKALDEEYIDLLPVQKGFEQLILLLGRVASREQGVAR